MAAHKHNIRKAFHLQLKQLWATNKFLKNHKLSRNSTRPSRPVADEAVYWGTEETTGPMAEVIADRYREFGETDTLLDPPTGDTNDHRRAKLLYYRRDPTMLRHFVQS